MFSRQHPNFRLLDGPVTEPFDCGEDGAAQTKFLREDAWEHQQAQYSRTYVMYYKGLLAGYVAVSSSEIQLSKSERPGDAPFARLPALKLVQMGVDARFQGEGLGRHLVEYAVLLALRAANTAGCRYLILDSRPGIVEFYLKQGFVVNEEHQEQKRKQARTAKRDPEKETVSMRFDLRRPGETEVRPLAERSAMVSRIFGLIGALGAMVPRRSGERGQPRHD